MAYTPPAPDAIVFDLEVYTHPASDAIAFDLTDVSILLYYVVYLASETDPTDAQIVSGLSWTPAVAAGNEPVREDTGQQTFPEISGLADGIYKVAFVAYDGTDYSNLVISGPVVVGGIAFDAGTFSLTGGDVNFAKAVNTTLDAGSFALTGGEVNFASSLITALAAGSFTLTGGDVNFAKGGSTALDAGSFALTGGAVNFSKAFSTTLDAGVFSLTGGVVNFEYDGERVYRINGVRI
jgi:hypothetical protein